MTTQIASSPPGSAKSSVPFPIITGDVHHVRLKPLPEASPRLIPEDSYALFLPSRTGSTPSSPLRSPTAMVRSPSYPFPVSTPVTPDYDQASSTASASTSPTSPRTALESLEPVVSGPSAYSQASAALSRQRSPMPSAPVEDTSVRHKVGVIWRKVMMGCCGHND